MSRLFLGLLSTAGRLATPLAVFLSFGSVAGAASPWNVAVIDPSLGVRVFLNHGMDNSLEGVGHQYYPSSLFDLEFITATAANTLDCDRPLYTVPSGKNLIIRELTGIAFSEELDEPVFYPADVLKYDKKMTQGRRVVEVQPSQEAGAFIPEGASLCVSHVNDSVTFGYIHGYIVSAVANGVGWSSQNEHWPFALKSMSEILYTDRAMLRSSVGLLPLFRGFQLPKLIPPQVR